MLLIDNPQWGFPKSKYYYVYEKARIFKAIYLFTAHCTHPPQRYRIINEPQLYNTAFTCYCSSCTGGGSWHL